MNCFYSFSSMRHISHILIYLNVMKKYKVNYKEINIKLSAMLGIFKLAPHTRISIL